MSRHFVSRFNPRAREGRDSDAFFLKKNQKSFNPRAREGRDNEAAAMPSAYTVSIHAPARGATNGDGAFAGSFLFQSTRPRGARPIRSGI